MVDNNYSAARLELILMDQVLNFARWAQIENYQELVRRYFDGGDR